QLGAYGWVEQLRRDPDRASEGHLLAPSRAHAATAAVLRSGWTSFDADAPDPGLAVDTSSARVRLGQWLLDGLRQGQAAGDRLGYRFERGVHDRDLDRCIDDVRRRVAKATGRGNERQPVDGLELWNLWRADDAVLKDLAKATPGLGAELDAIGDALDAVLDLTSAESVYQLVQGNFTRAAASLDALGSADVDPSECSFPQTPRAGRTITHRLLVSLPDASPIAAGDGWTTSPRASAAPALERWVRSVLGPASAYGIVTRWVDAGGSVLQTSAPIAASALGLSALDVVYLVGDASDGGSRLLARLRDALPSTSAPPGGRLDLMPDARDGLAPGQANGARLFQLARLVRDLLGKCRPARAPHLCRSGSDAGDALDVTELVKRARAVAPQLTSAEQRLVAALPTALRAPGAPDATSLDPTGSSLDRQLDAVLAEPAAVDVPRLRAALLDVDRFAIEANPPAELASAGVTPAPADAALLRALLRVAVSAARSLAARSAEIATLAAELGDGKSSESRLNAARAIFAAAFGRDFPVPESVRLPSDAARELAQSLAASGTRPGEGAGSGLHWLATVARVRADARRLGDVLLARAGSELPALGLQTAQLPHYQVGGVPERWAATGLPDADAHPRLCLLCCGERLSLASDASALQALLVDQWNETIPDAQQTAAVAFHYDAPAARAPQAILLALVPDGQKKWTCDDVLATVRETFEWSRLRAVGPEQLAQAPTNLSQYLPATFSPVPFELPGTLLQGASDLTHRWRLEGKTTTEDLEVGLQARIADPLWLMARQWQLGEFRGEDANTPVYAAIELETTPLASLRLEPGGATSARPVPISAPDAIEAYVEAEDARATPGAYGARANAGLRLLSMLSDAGLGAFGRALRSAFPLPAPEPARVAELDALERRRLTELSERALDADALAARLRSDASLAGVVDATAAERRTLGALGATWLAQLDADAAAQHAGSAWAPERMEYGLSLAASSGEGELTLRAAEYAGGRLDWTAFDLVAKGRHGLGAARADSRSVVRIPTPLRYAGMPADRFWEFEDGEVNFGAVQTTPADLQRLLVTRFALTQGPDWFHVPISLPSGQLVRVKAMHVVDSFGVKHPIPSLAALDQQRDARRPWRMFELTGDPGPASGRAPWLLLGPALSETLEGPAIERVQFSRDETSNLVWASERIVEGPLGDGIDRALSWKRSAAPSAPPRSRERDAPGSYRYEVAPLTPSYLVPFIPVREAGSTQQVRLRRGRVQRGVDAAGRAQTSGAVGQLLAPGTSGGPLYIFEEEIPRGGVEVTRNWQLARDRQGRVWLWLGQRKRPARPSKEPGIAFDRLTKR
ncbi:MAG TPA: hypothetical protein VMG12_42210, partial [Polyangiaceae bacterium]|nr:hypothetical protein [Polyangiaceae bacterium]